MRERYAMKRLLTLVNKERKKRCLCQWNEKGNLIDQMLLVIACDDINIRKKHITLAWT